MVHITFLLCITLMFPWSKNKQVNKILFIISFFVLFIFSAIRYGFGNDYFSYSKIYDAVQNKWYIANKRDLLGYYQKQHLFLLINKLSPSFNFFICFTSFLFVSVVAVFVYKNVADNYRWLSLFIFLINPYCLCHTVS